MELNSSFFSLYNRLVSAAVMNNLDKELEEARKIPEYDAHHIECLLYPEKLSPVFRISECDCNGEEKAPCMEACIFDAIHRGKDGNVKILSDRCTGCGECVENCKAKNLTDRKDILPVFELIYSSKAPVYAMIAPAFQGQFSEEVTPGKLRSAFKKLGFAGMVEVALFADILTLKEALEFDVAIQKDSDFLLTSCCCPIWISMIRKIYNTLIPHLPPSVSPMVACGRSIKKLYPGAKTVFIGPCIAKKAEAREKDIADSTDYVLTFQEMQDIFELTGIDPAEFSEDLRDHSSTAGRIYARTGGVSEAVQNTVNRLNPGRKIPLRSKQGNGVRECKKLLNDIKEGVIDVNFIEGMGCVGGCVGGPKAIIDKELGAANVNAYGGNAKYKTPVDNPYVIELLNRLGFDTIDSLLKKEHMFNRDFDQGTVP